MHPPRHALSALLVCSLLTAMVRAEPADAPLSVSPAEFVLNGRAARQRLLVTHGTGERAVDRTRQSEYRSETPDVIRVSADGVVTPVGSGNGVIVVAFEGKQTRATVRVVNGDRLLPVTFERDVQPVLTRTGCNAGACHGKARGQNGFALSLLGFDSDFDHAAIALEGRGRRVLPSSPSNSLFLLKPTGQMPHGGGKRIETGDAWYDVLHRWIAAGMPRTPSDAPRVERITVEPTERILAANAQQPLVVTAHYSDGSREDVTHLTTFQSNESVIAGVTSDGLIQAGPLPGEAAIMARFMEKFAVCNIVIPLAGSVPAEVYDRLPRNNFIDGHVWTKLQRLGITPSEPCSDATFHRRAFLDVIGQLPTPDETRAFLADRSPDRRAKLIDRLLDRPEYADYWANKWADLLRPNPYRVGIKAVYNLDAWLRQVFRENWPYDRFVREILTAQGSTFRHGPSVIYRDRREPAEITTMLSQLFLGVRLDCARCHHHPFEVYSQDDFYSLAAYFARLGRKGTGLSPPISGGEETLFVSDRGSVKHPISGVELSPRPLFGKAREITEDEDPRRALADWVVSPDNPFFSRVIVNRIWADVMDRGIVDPVDDLRATNPPSNGPLLDALADDFRRQGYDLKKLLKTILTSHTYALSSKPTERNVADTRNYSRHYRQRLRAEVLLDAVGDVTGVSETFSAMPTGSRAVQLWTFRSQSLFLDSFGRPDPNQDPPCERASDTTVVQALHLMNAPKLHQKVTADDGRAAKLAASTKTPAEIVDELYLLTYCRLPDEDERRQCVQLFEEKGGTRRRVAEDLLWALINTPEFVFKD